ncbi:MAG: hypothetical protein Tsb002_13220 [Wenzhouxiangellaceae bacterium]
MRTIEGTVSEDLKAFLGDQVIAKADAFEVRTYRELMSHVAKLAFLNKDHLLFYRGQNTDYKNRAGSSTFYPNIYRDDPLPTQEVHYRFELLNQASKMLADAVQEQHINGAQEIKRKKYIQWSILQHYEVCSTPLLDFTHSLRVACSFAQLNNSTGSAFVYVFGLPYITNRISINSEHDLVNVRLLSICPPDALRPYYQDGYVAGTEDITQDYDSKTELDFRNRLIAKFKIPSSSKFWGKGFSSIPETALYPRSDRFLLLCESLKVSLEQDLRPQEIGEFLKHWTRLEELLNEYTKSLSDRRYSPGRSISLLQKYDKLTKDQAIQLDVLRKFRNQLVHQPKAIEPGEIGAYTQDLRNILSNLNLK